MKTIQTTKLSFKQFDNLADQEYLRHGVSLRQKPGDVMCNFSSRNPPLARKSKIQLCNALRLDANNLIRHKQVHGNRIAVVTDPGETVGDADGLCTSRFDVPMLLLGADCPLIIVYDPKTPAVGLAHAGWRGIVQQVTMNLVEAMRGEFGCRAENMFAGIGPGICKNCYIVGEEVMMIAVMNLQMIRGLFRPAPAKNTSHRNRWFLDLIEANRRQLLQSGIPAEHIETSGYCTYERTDLFHSYRRQGTQAGRWALLAGLAQS